MESGLNVHFSRSSNKNTYMQRIHTSRPSRLVCKYRDIEIDHHGRTSTSPRRTFSSITLNSGGSNTSTALPQETKCQAISPHPLALNSTSKPPSGISVITWFAWNRKSRATGAALGAKRQRTGPCSASEKNDPKDCAQWALMQKSGSRTKPRPVTAKSLIRSYRY
jgi:hypothetical protein